MKEVIANAATQGGTALLRLEHVGKIYGNKDAMTCALDDVSLTVDRREFVAIMGPSGSGKSTLLNCIATIDTATSGHIWLAGQDITRMRGSALAKFRRDQLGFIFQDSNLLDTLTAHENIALALSLKGRPPREIDPAVRAMAHTLGAVYDTPHGVACAMTLPLVMEFNQEATGEKYREIARAMGVKNVDSMTQAEYRAAAIDAVRKLSADVGIPTKLEALREEDLPFLAESASKDACAPGNPREASVADFTALFRKLM